MNSIKIIANNALEHKYISKRQPTAFHKLRHVQRHHYGILYPGIFTSAPSTNDNNHKDGYKYDKENGGENDGYNGALGQSLDDWTQIIIVVAVVATVLVTITLHCRIYTATVPTAKLAGHTVTYNKDLQGFTMKRNNHEWFCWVFLMPF